MIKSSAVKIMASVPILLGLYSCAVNKPADAPEMGTVYKPLTREMILVGDNQEHNLGGLPVASLNALSVDRVAEVTVRPPQQSLFGRKLVQAIVTSNPSTNIVHLGDLLDVSCIEEWERVSPIVLQKNVALAHGNHDGIAHGIFNNLDEPASKELYTGQGWKYECFRPYRYRDGAVVKMNSAVTRTDEGLANLFTSADFISRYVKHKADVDSIAPNAPFTYFPDGYVQQIAGHIEPEADCFKKEKCKKFTQSYVIQKVKLDSVGDKNVYMIVMDTSQYDRSFRMKGLDLRFLFKDNPGVFGSILDDQIQAIRALLINRGPNDIYVFAGHHHWASIDPASKQRIQAIFTKLSDQPILYFSAHTHTGFIKKWDLDSGRALTEVNINSLADWPVGMKVMSMDISEDGQSIRVNSKIAMEKKDQLYSRDLRLYEAWTKSCISSGSITQKSFERHAEIAASHKRNGQAFTNYAAMWFYRVMDKDGSNYRNLLYEQKFNDLVHSRQVIDQLLIDKPGFRKNLEQYLVGHKGGVCNGLDFNNCMNKFVIEPWALYKVDERKHDAKRYYWLMSEFYTAAQKAIDDAQEPDQVAYMKCAFVSAAIQDRWDRSPLDISERDYNQEDFFTDTIVAPMN